MLEDVRTKKFFNNLKIAQQEAIATKRALAKAPREFEPLLTPDELDIRNRQIADKHFVAPKPLRIDHVKSGESDRLATGRPRG